MLLTKPQVLLFWREWSSIVIANNWDKKTAEEQRHLLIQRAGFDSLTKVTKKQGFDELLAQLYALNQRTDAQLAPQLRQIRMPRTRILWKIQNELLPLLAIVLNQGQYTDDHANAETYILQIMQDKYKTTSFADLKDRQLSLLLVDTTRAINQRRKALGETWPGLRALAAGQPSSHQAAA